MREQVCEKKTGSGELVELNRTDKRRLEKQIPFKKRLTRRLEWTQYYGALIKEGKVKKAGIVFQ